MHEGGENQQGLWGDALEVQDKKRDAALASRFAAQSRQSKEMLGSTLYLRRICSTLAFSIPAKAGKTEQNNSFDLVRRSAVAVEASLRSSRLLRD